VTVTDVKYAQFINQLTTAAVSTGLGSDIVVLILGGLATVLPGSGAKTALAAGVTGVTGAKASFDKNVFYQKTLSAIITEMDANRLTVLQDIRTNEKKGAAEYSLGDALNDVSRYEAAGSINSAISSITNKVQQNADKQATILQQIQRTPAEAKEFGGSDATALRATLYDKIKGLDDGNAIIAANKFLVGKAQPFVHGDAARQDLLLRVRFAKNLAEIKAIGDALP
jgi:hypothetical protein